MSFRVRKAWIFTNHSPAEIFSAYSSIHEDDRIVAADAGLDAISSLGLIPDILIGDLDSLDDIVLQRYPHVPRLTSSSRKNETDTELAVDWCLGNGYRDIVICNDLGGRFDHALGIIQAMYAAHLHGANCRVESETQCLFFLPERWTAKDYTGCTLSLIAWTSEALVESTGRLEYPLKKLLLNIL